MVRKPDKRRLLAALALAALAATCALALAQKPPEPPASAFGVPGFAVDTHVKRLTRRLGLTKSTDPVKIEADVTKLIPPSEWTGFSLRLILHGRRICVARAPRCPECVLNDFCPSSTVRAKARRPSLRASGRAVTLAHGR